MPTLPGGPIDWSLFTSLCCRVVKRVQAGHILGQSLQQLARIVQKLGQGAAEADQLLVRGLAALEAAAEVASSQLASSDGKVCV